jgi:hypothetical protein
MMRKFLITFLTVLAISCSKDGANNGDNSNSNQDLIIGTWKLFKLVDVKPDGTEDTEIYSLCRQNTRHDYYLDGSFDMQNYSIRNGDCVHNDDWNVWVLINAKWRKISEGKYEITLEQRNRSDETTITNNSVLTIEFPDSNTHHIIGHAFSSEYEYRYIVFERMN